MIINLGRSNLTFPVPNEWRVPGNRTDNLPKAMATGERPKAVGEPGGTTNIVIPKSGGASPPRSQSVDPQREMVNRNVQS